MHRHGIDQSSNRQQHRRRVWRRGLPVIAVAVLPAVLVACGNDGPPRAAAPTTVAPDAPAASTLADDSAGLPSTTGADGSAVTTGLTPSADAYDATGEARVMVISRDNTFTPEELIVSVGTEVVWRNGGRTEHDLFPVDATLDWGVAIEDFPPGATYSHVFDEPGAYPYYCTIHGTTDRGMVGTIFVQ